MTKKIEDYKVGDVIKLRTDYDKQPDITPGKIYVGKVVHIPGGGYRYMVANTPDDDDYLLYCLVGTGCAHIDGNKWEIVEDD